MSADPGEWTGLVALGRLYGLAGELLRDEFVPGADPSWPDAWHEALGFREGLMAAELSDALLRALEEARQRPAVAAAERSRLLLLGDCPAYETAYAHTFSRQRELADIAGFYRAFGVRIEGERPDHLAVECEFASLLCTKEAVAAASGLTEERARTREARAAFLADHLGTWLFLYGEDLRSRAQLPLLGAAVAIIRALVQSDAAALGVTVDDRERPAAEDVSAPPPCGPSVAGAS